MSSLKTVTELLEKQKVVEKMLRNQTMRRQDLVESVTHKQHLIELQTLLKRLPASEISSILEALSIDDAKLLWAQVIPEQQDDVLWLLTDSVLQTLAGDRQPRFSQGQINAYEFVEGRVQIKEITCRSELAAIQPIWLDLLSASDSERHAIARHFGLHLPDPDDLTDLEVSARFYLEDNDAIYLNSNFLLARGENSRSIPVAFIVYKDILFTVRNEDLPVFRLQRLRARNQDGSFTNGKDILLELYDADIEYSADELEESYALLREAGQKILRKSITDSEATRILADVAVTEDVNGVIRGNMLNTQRAVSFLIRGRFLSAEQVVIANQILHDIDSINSHTVFLFEKINFLMDATAGYVNVSQNRHMSQLTLINIVFMPLNLLAGIGGMSEFSMMTEGIAWPVSFGFLLTGMLVIGWLTYVFLEYFGKAK